MFPGTLHLKKDLQTLQEGKRSAANQAAGAPASSSNGGAAAAAAALLDSGEAAQQLEALAAEVLALREQSLTHVKERVALKSILDDKVRPLIGDVGQSLAELPIEVGRLIWLLPGVRLSFKRDARMCSSAVLPRRPKHIWQLMLQ
jgi:hypothetical protein